MTQIYNYNPERKGSGFADLYLMAFFAAFVLVFLLIVSGYGIKFLVAFVIKYYLWVFGVLTVIAIARHYWTKGDRRNDICEYR
jgi:hypothetical protein